VEVQAFLSKRSGREYMRPEGRIERSPHIICTQAILATGKNIFDLGIRERHCGMAAKQKTFVARAGFVQSMTPFVQSEGFEEIARKARNSIGVESARYP
jgi:hypothetical protein